MAILADSSDIALAAASPIAIGTALDTLTVGRGYPSSRIPTESIALSSIA